MNPEYTTARADDPRLASASAPDATPVPASRTSDTPLGATHFLTLAAAKKAADVAMSSALDKGYPVSVTVVGPASVPAEIVPGFTAPPPLIVGFARKLGEALTTAANSAIRSGWPFAGSRINKFRTVWI
jgi:hypothetical protein